MNRKQLPFPLLVSISLKGQITFQKTFSQLPIVIGRHANCDIPLTEYDFLSRQHCAINMENDCLEVTDLDSSNGVYFEGKKVKKIQINGPTQFTVGEIQIKIEPIQAQEHATVITDSGNEKTVIKDVSFLEQVAAIESAPSSPPPVEDAPKPLDRIPFDPAPKMSADLPNPAEFGAVHFSEAKISDKPNVKPEVSKKVKSLKPIGPHPQAGQLRPQQRVLESYVTWKDQIYDLHQFYAGDNVIVGPTEQATVALPILNRNYRMAKFDGMNTQVYIPQNLRFELENEEKAYSFDESAFSPSVSRKKNYYTLKLGASELVSIQITPDVTFHLRYAPAPRQLANKIRFIKDEELKIPGVVVATLEILIFMLIFFTKTKEFDTPQKIMQERVAKLIVEQKPPPPPPPEPKKPEPPKEKKVAKKEPTPAKPQKVVKKQPRPKKIVKISKSKKLAKVNKYPVEVEKPLKAATKPVVTNIQAVGALAALGAVSSKAPPSAVPVAINVNPNAGGQTALNTGGVIGTLKTKSGKLAAGGMAQVKTKGLGYGTGTGYGVQGIKGTAGSRAVAGTVVGAPALVNLSKEDGLTRAQVMDVVKRYMTQIQQCYERSLIDNPNIVGRVEYEWEIVPKGAVKWAKVKKSDIAGGDSLNRCVTGVFKQMKFPVAKNGQNTIPNIGFPFGRL